MCINAATDAKSARGVRVRSRFAAAVTYVAEGSDVSSAVVDGESVVVDSVLWALSSPLADWVIEGPVGVDEVWAAAEEVQSCE